MPSGPRAGAQVAQRESLFPPRLPAGVAVTGGIGEMPLRTARPRPARIEDHQPIGSEGPSASPDGRGKTADSTIEDTKLRKQPRQTGSRGMANEKSGTTKSGRSSKDHPRSIAAAGGRDHVSWRSRTGANPRAHHLERTRAGARGEPTPAATRGVGAREVGLSNEQAPTATGADRPSRTTSMRAPRRSADPHAQPRGSSARTRARPATAMASRAFCDFLAVARRRGRPRRGPQEGVRGQVAPASRRSTVGER